MNSNSFEEIELSDFFVVSTGDYHATKDLDPGNIPLVSCKDSENGFLGYFDIPKNKTYQNAITVAYNGRPLAAKFHPYKFGAKDDVAVLKPIFPLRETTLLYVASQLCRLMWRYSYGRKCYREKMEKVKILIPITRSNGEVNIDEESIVGIFPRKFNSYLPLKSQIEIADLPFINWKIFNILDLFNIKRGDFHSIADLYPGNIPTVSRVTDNNGIVGYYEPPDGAEIYRRGLITVSTVGGDAFLQLDDFIATDNVIVCNPKQELKITTMYFITLMLNYQKWRYSYGRQCYKEKFSQVSIFVPVNYDSGSSTVNRGHEHHLAISAISA